MPVLALLADFADVPRAIVVTAYQSASGVDEPTSAVVVGGQALAKVGYNRYLRLLAPLLGILFVLVLIFVGIAAVIS